MYLLVQVIQGVKTVKIRDIFENCKYLGGFVISSDG